MVEVTITRGQTTPGVNIDLDSRPPDTGVIAGVVRSNGLPLSEARVFLFRHGQEDSEDVVHTDSDGKYRFDAVPVGNDYQVAFTFFPSTTTWYNNSLSRANAKLISVKTGTTNNNIDGSLIQLGGCISGKVVDGISFTVQDTKGNVLPIYLQYNGWGPRPEAFTYGFTDLDGGFVACGLPTGSYIINCFGYNEGSVFAEVVAPQETASIICVANNSGKVYLPVLSKK